jgi:hypothetical protein
MREKDAKLADIEARQAATEARLARLENVEVELPVEHGDVAGALESQRLLDVAGREAAIGEEQLHLHRACRLLLNFMASEMSEMICSAWCMVMLPMLYYSPHKKYMYTIDELDDAGFKQALTFSSVDFLLEAATFAAMLLVFSLHANINVAVVGVEYVRTKNLFLPILSSGVLVTVASFAYFVKHTGENDENQSSPCSSSRTPLTPLPPGWIRILSGTSSMGTQHKRVVGGGGHVCRPVINVIVCFIATS